MRKSTVAMVARTPRRGYASGLGAHLRIAVAAVSALAAPCAMADARDGLIHWWRASDLNGDGLLQPGELYDAMTISAANPLTASLIVQDAESEMAVPASIGTGVTRASMRKTYADAEYFSLNNPTNYDANGDLVANWQSITLSNASSMAVPVGAFEGTVIARFRWHGCSSKKNNAGSGYNYNVTLFANNYYPNAARGWRISLRCYDSGTSTLMYPSMYIGNGKSYEEFGTFGVGSNFLVRKGMWCDLAVSFSRDAEGNVAVLYVLRNSEFTNSRDRNHQTFTKTGTQTTMASAAAGVYPSYIGYNGMTGFESPLARGEDTFGGDIYDIRVYDRAMGEYEALAELVDSAPLCEIGSANGSGDEFSDSGAAAVYEPATMDWSRMRKTLNAANPSLSVKCDVEENGHSLGRLVELKVIKGGASGSVEVAANGVTFGRKVVNADGWLRFFVSEQRMSTLVKDAETGKYPLTLTFTRKGDLSADLVVDYLRVGGAWQLGAADNKTDGFGGNGDNYYNFFYCVGQNDISQFVSSLGTQGLYAYLNLYFPVGDWAAANLAHRLTVKSSGNNRSELTFKLNGSDDALATFAENELYNGGHGATIDLPAGAIAGANRIYLDCPAASPTVWSSFDYWRLETVWTGKNYDTGTTIIFK